MSTTATDDVTRLLGRDFGKCESPSLRIEKFVVMEDTGKKLDEIRKICSCINSNATTPAFRFSDLPGAGILVMKLQSRLVVNHAGGILENAGLCLHPHFGCPMIPGSAVKGIARAAAIQLIRDTDNTREQTRLLTAAALTFGWCPQDWRTDTKNGSAVSDWRYAAGESWQTVWKETADVLLAILNERKNRIDRGAPWTPLPDFAGLVSFLPALPAKESRIRVVPDLVNCHHPEYYNGNRAVAEDTENPIPNYFPAIDAGMCFEFVVVPVRRPILNRIAVTLPDFNPVAAALGWLETGLSSRGAGAKTNAGYGWFEIDADAQRRETEARALAEQAARQAAEQAEADRREQARRNALSPEEYAADEYRRSLGGGDLTTKVKGDMAIISSLAPEKQLGLCLYLLLDNGGKTVWERETTEAAKYCGPQDEKKHGKAHKRVANVRAEAGKLGVNLP